MRFLSIYFSRFSLSHFTPSAKFRAQRLEFHKHCQDLSRLAPWRRTLRCISMLENRRGKAWTVMTLKRSQKNKSETKMNILVCDILPKKTLSSTVHLFSSNFTIWDWLSLVSYQTIVVGSVLSHFEFPFKAWTLFSHPLPLKSVTHTNSLLPCGPSNINWL